MVMMVVTFVVVMMMAMMIHAYGAFVNCDWKGKSEVFRKTAPVPLVRDGSTHPVCYKATLAEMGSG
jgi:hypothetical protein